MQLWKAYPERQEPRAVMVEDIQSENIAYESARTALYMQHQDKLRALKAKLEQEINGVNDKNQKTKEDLERAYNVELSRKRDDYAEKLAELRATMSKQIETEKLQGESEVEKTRARYREQLARYREIGEKTLSELQRKYESAAEKTKAKIAKEKGRA